MPAQLIKGSEVAKEIRVELKQEIAELKAKHNLVPGLATVLVGEDPASQVYVGAKEKTANELGVYSERHDLPADTSQADLLKLVDKLNKDPKIHGILVQLPLPKHINETTVLYAINPKKDVDGFHPTNLGKLMIGEPDFIPCTPHGIWQLLVRSGTKIEGAEVVVVGRSNIVGKPIANILLQKHKDANATVTICHTRTRDMAFHTKRADILIVAAGKANLIKPEQIQEGAFVIDVGINRVKVLDENGDPVLNDKGKPKSKTVGDVQFDTVKEKAGKITPVPGGVGAITNMMLMRNTIKAAKIQNGLL